MGLFGGGGTNASQNSKLLGYRVSTSVSGKVIPLVFGKNRIAGNVIWTGDWKAHEHTSGGFYHVLTLGASPTTKTYTYSSAGEIAVCMGPIQGVSAIWQSEGSKGGQNTDILAASHGKKEDGLNIFTGTADQAPWSYLTSHHADQALGYSRIAYVAGSNWDLGSSGVFPNYSYEVIGMNVYPDRDDALCTVVIEQLLTDATIGAGLDPSEVDASEAATYCLANGLFVSPVLDQQKPAAEWLQGLLLIANAEAVWSEGILKIRSRGDATVTGNGTTFTPNLTPVANLSDENGDFKDKDEPVRIIRPNPRDAYNSVTVNWTNRGNQYNTEPLQESDRALIETYGLRPASSVDAVGICTADVASKVAHIQLKRNIYNRTRYKFRLGFEHILFEPMDIVTLTCQVNGITYQRLDHAPVRLLSMAEDEDGYLSCEAEEIPTGSGSVIAHPKQTGRGFLESRQLPPGSIKAPIFYEACPAMKQLLGVPYALLIGLCGGPTWGGCTVWRSFDGTSYDRIGQKAGQSVRGELTASLGIGADPDSGNTCSVLLLESFGELASVTQDDADNFKTLFLVGSELMSFETATLTNPYSYDLTYLRRGVYGSVIDAHSIGDSWLLLNNQTCFEWDYQSQDVHKTVYFKFTSFNTYGNKEENLADVPAYSYTLTGGLTGIKTVTSDYTLQPADVGINVDTTAGPVTITIPDSVATVNTQTSITKITGDTNSVIVTGSSISGESTTSISRQYESQTIQSTDQQWVLISKSPPKFADNETPAGIMDGTNPIFTLFATPSPIQSLRLYYNGVEQLQGADISITDTIVTFLRSDNLPDDAYGDSLRAFYRY